MANLTPSTRISGVGVKYDFFQHRFYGGDNYFHYKTNIALSTYVMVMIEAIGYAYGANQSIRSSWVFYSYSYLASAGTANVYSGLSADGVYVSSDGYVCIRANCASYFSGWCFNAYTVCPAGFNADVTFTAVVQTSNSGNYY
jgi:hypothetical protein